MSDYIDVQEAAEYTKNSVQSVYIAIRRGTLKGKKINGKIFTKKEWVNEFKSTPNNRQRGNFQGKPIFNYEAGEWSVRMVASYLNTSVLSVHYLLTNGFLTSTRKASRHVIQKSTVDNMLETRGFKRVIQKPRFKIAA